MYTYIYIHTNIPEGVGSRKSVSKTCLNHTHVDTHTHTNTYTYIHIYLYMYTHTHIYLKGWARERAYLRLG